ncbi:MAG: M23 family metallopeptidase [Ruthenibacterium sp.]
MSKIKTKDAQFVANAGRGAAQARDTLLHVKDSVRDETQPQQGSAENYAADAVGDAAQAVVSNAPQAYRAMQQARSALRPKTREFVQDTGAHTAKSAASNGGAYDYSGFHANTNLPALSSPLPHEAPRVIGNEYEPIAQAANPMQQHKQHMAQRRARTPAGKNAAHNARHGNNSVRDAFSQATTQHEAGTQHIKQKRKAITKPTYRTVKTAQQTGRISVKTTKATVMQAKHAATKAAQAAQKAKQIAQAAAKTATQAAKLAAKATAATVKAIFAAAKSLIAALVAGGSVSIVIILVVLMIGLLLGSGFGIFFANDVPDGEKLSAVVQALSDEYYEQIREIEQRVPHDYVEYEAADGITAIVWPDVLSVYAAQTAINPANGMEVVTITPEKRQKIRDILWDMNRVSHRTYVTQREIEVEKTDAHGKPYLDTEIIAETHLMIEITRKLPQEMASIYNFNADQQEQLTLLLEPQYSHLWIRLLGNLQGGSIGGAHDGEIMTPGIGGSGVLAWPLPIAGSISSPFGYRKDPFSGKWSFHRGLDIAAPNGTPILAAADGIVVVANATDSWGYSWGYYVKIQHPKGMTTLYAHCSVIAASAGQQVQRGEVIAYVGNTGASTGNHLHFEVTDDGRLVNALNYFTA